MAALSVDLARLGLAQGDIVLVHSSFRSLQVGNPEDIVCALVNLIGPDGTLMMPALSYRQQPCHIHDTRSTPTCVGFLSEYFRTRTGTVRSLHPTHSVCAIGRRANEMLGDHFLDRTPCGPNSPFNRLIEVGGKILMIGCGLRPNTTMHAVEEHVVPAYLLGLEREYEITGADGVTFRTTYVTHGFRGVHQRYDRAASLLSASDLSSGQVGSAECHLINAAALYQVAVDKMNRDPFYFVEPVHP